MNRKTFRNITLLVLIGFLMLFSIVISYRNLVYAEDTKAEDLGKIKNFTILPNDPKEATVVTPHFLVVNDDGIITMKAIIYGFDVVEGNWHYKSFKNFHVVIYDKFNGEEKKIFTSKKKDIKFSDEHSTEEIDLKVDYKANVPGKHEFKAVFYADGKSIMESKSIGLDIYKESPRNYISIGNQKSNKDRSKCILYGFSVLGSDIDDYKINKGKYEETSHSQYIQNFEIDVTLPRDTDPNAELKLAPNTSRSAYPSACYNTRSPYSTYDSIEIRKHGIEANLNDGKGRVEFYVKYYNGYFEKYHINFKRAEASSKDDPAPDAVEKLKIEKKSENLEGVSGQSFDKNQLKVIAVLKDGSEQEVNGYKIEPGVLTTSTKKITLKYGGKTAEADIKVWGDTGISDIEISNGQLSQPGIYYDFNTIKFKKNTYEAVSAYGDTTGKFSFKLNDTENIEVFQDGRKLTPQNDGTVKFEAPANGDGIWEKDEFIFGNQKTVIKVANIDGGKKHSQEYVFTCYSQTFSGLPDRVVDYLCLGSQYTNNSSMGPYGRNPIGTIRGTKEMHTCSKNVMTGPCSLGNFGGYITYYYKDPLVDDPRNPYGIDFIAFGNPVNPNGFDEPGQVYVSEDGSKWYALAGSNHFEDHCIWDYSVKYKNNYTYETSDGASGSSALIFKFPKKENYPLHKFPEGEISELTGRGVLIQSAKGKNAYGNVIPMPTRFGYVDVGAMGTDNHSVNPYEGYSENGDPMDLSWAVDDNGMPVDVSNMKFHYVRVQTADFCNNEGIGEKSTEIHMVRRAAEDAIEVGKTEMPSSITVAGNKIPLKKGQNIYSAEVSGVFEVSVDAPKTTNVYINVVGKHRNVFYTMPKHKIVRVIIQEGRKEPIILYIKLKEKNTPEKGVDFVFNGNGGKITDVNHDLTSPLDLGKSEMTAFYPDSSIGVHLPEAEHEDELDNEYKLFKYTFQGWEFEGKVYNNYSEELKKVIEKKGLKKITLKAKWKKEAEKSKDDIKVSFRLIGSTQANSDIDLKDKNYKGAEYQTWLKTREVTVKENAVVADVIEKVFDENKIKSRGLDTGYISMIKAPEVLGGYELSERSNGERSGWMYTLNGEHTDGIKVQHVKDNDSIVLHYVNDYAYEVHDWDKLGGSGFPSLGDGTYFSKWLEAEDTDPVKYYNVTFKGPGSEDFIGSSRSKEGENYSFKINHDDRFIYEADIKVGEHPSQGITYVSSSFETTVKQKTDGDIVITTNKKMKPYGQLMKTNLVTGQLKNKKYLWIFTLPFKPVNDGNTFTYKNKPTYVSAKHGGYATLHFDKSPTFYLPQLIALGKFKEVPLTDKNKPIIINHDGDVNKSGGFDYDDIKLIQKIIDGEVLDFKTISEEGILNADINADMKVDYADIVQGKIMLLPKPEDIVESDREKIETLRAEYEKLDDKLRDSVDNIQDLINAESKLKELKDLETNKESAIKTLKEYKDPSFYREEQKNELSNKIEAGIKAINEAVSKEEVAEALKKSKEELDTIKTDAQLKEEESALEAEKILADAKESAIKTLKEYKDPSFYREEQKNELSNKIEAGIKAINEAVSKEEVAEALKKSKEELDTIKTDAQLKEEKAALDVEKAQKTENEKTAIQEKRTSTGDAVNTNQYIVYIILAIATMGILCIRQENRK